MTIENFDRFSKELQKDFGVLGFFIYLKFLKAIEAEPLDNQIDPRAILDRTMRPILDRFASFKEKMESYLKEGLSLEDSLKKLACDIDSREDKEVFDLFKKEKIVEDGFKSFDPIRPKLTPAQTKKFLKVNPEDPLAQTNFFYDLFTARLRVHYKKKPRPKNKKKKK